MPTWHRVCQSVMALGWGVAFLLYRGSGHYAAPDFGGPEPAEMHRAALQILDTGVTDMTFHPTGYAYFSALVYLVAPNQPLSVLCAQILTLPLLVGMTASIAATLGANRVVAGWMAALYYPLGYFAVVFSSVFATLLFITTLVYLLHLPRHRAYSPWLAGLLLGAATCCRPYWGLLGVPLAWSQWRQAGSRGAARTVVIAATSLAMLAVMTLANPSAGPGVLRGEQGFSKSLLQGTWQYRGQWWDWEWTEDATTATGRALEADYRRIEAEAGASRTEPAAWPLMRRDAVQWMRDHPASFMRKVATSVVRIWIFVPTQFSSLGVKMLVAGQEFALLGLAVAGITLARKRRQPWLLPVAAMCVPTLVHAVLHVEPRYSLPARGMELAFAALALSVGIAWARRRFHGVSP